MTPPSFVDAETRIVALLGDPVSHSFSPPMHNAAFAAQQLNWAYVALRVRPEVLREAVAGLQALGLEGANVTIPHKERILPHLDVLEPSAQAVGAVNTVMVERRNDKPVRLRGANTDVTGFLKPLDAHADRLRGAPMLVFGAGGAARAVCYALVTRFQPSSLMVAARRPAQAEQLIHDVAPEDEETELQAVPWDEAAPSVRRSTLLVNATPLGMKPEIEGTPWPQSDDFSSDQIAYDLVYRPARTRFLQDAEAQGAMTVGGLAMLMGQAAAAYEHWTGRAMPTGAAREALQQHGILPGDGK